MADGVTSILMTSEAISAVGKNNLVSLLRFYRISVSYSVKGVDTKGL